MQLKFDTTKTYAIALEGGGARGAYEIGVWQALEEAGVRYNAVSGTSVGALNGALMTMRDLDRAIAAWKDIRLSDVIDLDPDEEQDLHKMLSGSVELSDIRQLVPLALEIIRNRGLDVAPLRSWVREIVDVSRIKSSDVEFFVSTVSLSDRKSLEIRIQDLADEEVCDMLLASAYHPTFRLERLGGKLYADGGFTDTLPLHVLVENGYKDIIAVRLPSAGRERLFRMPKDVRVTFIETHANLGSVLNFDAEQSRRNLAIGCLDAKRMLYGLYGEGYYIERTLTDRQALDWLLDYLPERDRKDGLRRMCERRLPALARRLGVHGGDYYELMVAAMEKESAQKGVDPLCIRTDEQLLRLL